MKKSKSKTEKAEVADRKEAEKVNINLTKKHPHPDALDKWNDRLDRNFESEREGNAQADDNARDYSEKYGSGDQSDED